MIITAWRRSPLRRRLRIGVAVVLVVTVVAADAVLLGAAGRAIEREVATSMAASDRHLRLVLSLLASVPPAEQRAAINALQGAYAQSRHVCLDIAGVGFVATPCTDAPDRPDVPQWFMARVTQPMAAQTHHHAVGEETLTLRLNPVIEDEAHEVWEETRTAMLALVFMAMLLHGVLAWLIGRSLTPLERAAAALDRLRAGEPLPTVHAPDETAAPPEFRSLSEGIRAFEQSVHDSRSMARTLHKAALDAQEQERRRLARELHDELGQQLSAIELEAAAMQPAIPAALAPGLARIAAAVRVTHHISRRVLQRLRPEALEALGLAGSLDGLLDGWLQRSDGWALSREIDPAVDALPPEQSIHIFRIAQEALTNVARHARAQQVVFRLTRAADALTLMVEDDGIGPAGQADASGFGLLGLAERVEALGGRWSISERPHGGTRLFVALPHPAG